MTNTFHSRSLLTITILALAGGAGWQVAAKDKPEVRPPLKLEVDAKPIDRDSNSPISYAPVVKRAASSVVYVFSSKKVHAQNLAPMLNDPMFRRFFGVPGPGGGGMVPRDQVQHSLGSGIIVSPDGYILTNNHVVDGADDVQVKFGKPEKEFKATIVGRDADADVAVLKIDATSLPAATLGDSDQVQVGDTVLAVGDPFGVGLTVTHGIVSALGRNAVGIEAFEDFIQTDAPINPGNSGGALLDSSGRVIGINTAILSGSGGSNGVGFAIPINLVKSLAEQLVLNGKVSRGFLGVHLQELTPDLAAQFGTTRGALVADVSPNTPAEKAGLKTGDIITKLNGKQVEGVAELRLAISGMAPGTEADLTYNRGGKEETVKINLSKLESKTLAEDQNGEKNDSGVLTGVTVGDITSDVRDGLQLPADLKGALITEVDPNSASARAGLNKGDVILELDRKPIHSAEEAAKLSDEVKGPKVLVRFWRGGSSRFVVVDESQ